MKEVQGFEVGIGMEMEQESEWNAAQNIFISEDLLSAAKLQLQFLTIVDRNRWLYENQTLQWAIFRYNAFWLPLALLNLYWIGLKKVQHYQPKMQTIKHFLQNIGAFFNLKMPLHDSVTTRMLFATPLHIVFDHKEQPLHPLLLYVS
ncbi:hypothetical protein L2E82_17762 [Cichorium intybus]|uniref:Uncharacterized protein n=1 Tax=Cichorium intybus TaxID=13427 RepID=A0ACB9F9P1_CICIN|nr:hypothetical protein L2E82_17762 [Cichorium intybus]